MPEYGLCDKSPEQIEEERAREQARQEWIAATRRIKAAEAEAAQRKADAENSSIQTAELLRRMMEQIHEIRDTQETEQQARILAESKAAEAARRQEKKDHKNWNLSLVSCIAAVIAAIAGFIALFR